MASSKALGVLRHIEVWHDNSGPGPSWRLWWVVVEEVGGGGVYNFHADQKLQSAPGHSLCASFQPTSEEDAEFIFSVI